MNYRGMLKAEDLFTLAGSKHKFEPVGECNGTAPNLCSLSLCDRYQWLNNERLSLKCFNRVVVIKCTSSIQWVLRCAIQGPIPQ